MRNSISKYRSRFTNNLINIPGFRTNRKIVVIESDDWGSIRMPSKEIYAIFLSKGYSLAKSDYNRLDNLENNEDLQSLFEVLLSHKDKHGNHPKFTANCIVGNPDFKKIRESDFTKYYFEPVTETLKNYPYRTAVESLWNKGNTEKIFHPQFHGREHVNIVRWMNSLQQRTSEIMFTFNHNTTFSGNGDYNFMEVLDYNTPAELSSLQEGLAQGLDLFEDIFGYRSKSFIPPCYTWNSDIEGVLFEKGIKYIQGLVVQSIPTGTFGSYKKKYHFMGDRNAFGQYFLIRNGFFEPSLDKASDTVDDCLRRIEIAFKWKKPAIISSHRINYVGSLDENNRTQNLKLLNNLLTRIIHIWPDVEFKFSDELGDIISGNRHQF